MENTRPNLLESHIMIIIRGYPAVGKTTIGLKVRDCIGNAVCISVDNIIQMLGDFRSRQNKTMGHIASRYLANFFMKQGMNIVIEELFADEISIRKTIELANQLHYNWFIFELESTISDIKARDKNFGRIHTQDIDRLLSILEKKYYHEPLAIKINTSNLSMETATREIVKIVESSINNISERQKGG